MHINIGQTSLNQLVSLPLKLANRHGVIAGATGTGKTVTMQAMIEQFSRAGVPVFAADIKGDLSGIAVKGQPGAIADRYAEMVGSYTPDACPVQLWDIYGEHGAPIRTSVQEMGTHLLATMLQLNQTQAGALEIAFRIAEDEKSYLLTLNDLRWSLNAMLEEREDVSRRYGNVTASSISAIQRNILALEAQGADQLFGEPPFEIADFLRQDSSHKGFVNLLDATQLIEAPRAYATLLLFLLTKLFRELPEVGDLGKPKLVFFFDESHLLFKDAPKSLLESIERLVRLVRSKGVGVFFASQAAADIPETVLAQLGTRIQHALRAYTPSSQRMVKATVAAFRKNTAVNTAEAIISMGIGEALVSVMSEGNIPSPVERIRILPPRGQVGPISQTARNELLQRSDVYLKFTKVVPDYEQAGMFRNRMLIKRGQNPLNVDVKASPEPANWSQILAPLNEISDLRNDKKPRYALRFFLCCGFLSLTLITLFFWIQ
ncbi:helicase HerA-like domain-containing protein [Brucella sp. TWI432]